MNRPLVIAVFLLAVLGLLVFLASFTQHGLGGGTYEIKAAFESTTNIREGAPVTLAGVTIGEVKDVRLDYENRGVITLLAIRGDKRIPRDSKLSVEEKGMLGETYLSFTFGRSSDFMKPGERVRGQPLGQMRDLLASASVSVEAVSRGLVDASNSIRALVDDVRREEIARKASATLEQAGAMAKRLDGVSVEIAAMVPEARKAVAQLSSLGMQAERLSVSALRTIETLNDPAGSAGRLLRDPRLYDNLNDTALAARDLLRYLEKHPSSLVWGRRNAGDNLVRKGSRRAGRAEGSIDEQTAAMGDAHE